jgi:RNA-binding protein PNO1
MVLLNQEERENILFQNPESNKMEIEDNYIEEDKINEEEIRRVKVPFHRLNPLKKSWENIVQLLTDKMALLIRMNLKTRQVELKNNANC